MALESLTQKLNDAFRKLTKTDKITEKHLDSLLTEVKSVLLDSDVSRIVVDEFIKGIAEKALGQKIFSNLKPNEALMTIVYDQLVDLLGPQSPQFDWPKGQKRIFVMVGLQGTGKTTSVAKLARLLQKQNTHKAILVAADTQRPAAIEQLRILGTSISTEVFYLEQESSSVQVVKKALERFKSGSEDCLIIDTAGRLHVDAPLMDELVQLIDLTKPDEILLTVDVMSGQDVIHVAQSFHERLALTGLVATKFDSEAKGGALLSVKRLTDVPVKLVGTGEKLDDFDLFYPDRMANRLIGMGDLMSLVEQAQEKMDQEAAQRSFNRMMEGQFSLSDMLDQFNQLDKMGSLKAMMGMLPGMGQMAQQVNDEDSKKAIAKSKAIILSMTLEEREDASLLRASRKNRIALGSGTSVTDVNKLISQFEKAKEQMRLLKRLAKNNPQ